MIKWDEKYPMRKISDTKARFVGMGMAMQALVYLVWMLEVPHLSLMMRACIQ